MMITKMNPNTVYLILRGMAIYCPFLSLNMTYHMKMHQLSPDKKIHITPFLFESDAEHLLYEA